MILFVMQIDSFAVPASPKIIHFREPDGKLVKIRQFGDEHFGYIKSLDGYILSSHPDGYLHYTNYNSGYKKVLPERYSAHSASDVASATTTIPLFVYNSLMISQFPHKDSGIMIRSNSRKNLSILQNTNINSLVLLVQFSDVKFSLANPEHEIDAVLNEQGYSLNGATGSATDYFSDNLGGIKINFELSPIITLSNPLSYYGADNERGIDVNIEELVIDAVREASLLGIDFSNYDFDSDGIIDNISIIYAGYNQAESAVGESIWAKQGVVTKDIQYNGVRIGSFVCVSELKGNSGAVPFGIGIFCHEFSHSLGLIDLYDTNFEEEGLGLGLWATLSIMDKGCYLNDCNTPPYYSAVDRDVLGIFEYEYLEGDKHYKFEELSPSNSKIYKATTSCEGEYFLFECRGNEGWDKYIGAAGLAIYHVDKSSNTYGMIESSQRWIFNNVNTNASHQCAYLLANTSNYDKGVEYALLPGKGNITELHTSSVPPLLDWSGMEIGLSLKEILYSASNKRLFFKTEKELKFSSSLPFALSVNCYPEETSVFIRWNSSSSSSSEESKWRVSLYDSEGSKVGEYFSTSNSIQITDILQNSSYKVVVQAVTDFEYGKWAEAFFETLELKEGYTYIKFNRLYKAGDDIVIVPKNLTEEYSSIYWTINSIQMDIDQVYRITEAGLYEVKVFIGYPDGSTDIFTKKIKVR